MNAKRKMDKNQSLLTRTAALFTIAFLAVIIGGLILFNKNQNEINDLSNTNSELGDVLNERDSLVNDLISAFDTIESNLTFINERRSQLVLENNETSPSKKESIVKDIQLMNTMLEESSKKIEELEKKFEQSGIQIKSFRNKIAKLNKRIEQQNHQIADLTVQVEEQNAMLTEIRIEKDSLQNTVQSFRDSLSIKEELLVQKEELIALQTGELNKGFFAYGTFKELTENGVVSKTGGFLGIGKNKILQNNFNEEYFTRIDITQDSIIPLNVKKVNLISEHPADSYKLIEEDGLITSLEIETPEDFWKVSQYAVIEVKL